MHKATMSVGALVVACALCFVSGCGGSDGKAPSASSGSKGSPPTAAQLQEAQRLLNPENSSPGPPAADVACVARVVVQDPNVDAMANDMAQIPNKDLRQLVMTDYLHCSYNFVLDLYMKFAPAGLATDELRCMRQKFTELSVDTLSEVMVEDPDAGQTGPLVMQACASHSSVNPLEHGLPNGGGS
jgi:hypothetical protein